MGYKYLGLKKELASWDTLSTAKIISGKNALGMGLIGFIFKKINEG